MRKLLSNLKALAETLLANAIYVYDTEPARVLALAASVVVFLAAKLGIVVDPQSVKDALAYVLPILLAGEVVRKKVKPVR